MHETKDVNDNIFEVIEMKKVDIPIGPEINLGHLSVTSFQYNKKVRGEFCVATMISQLPISYRTQYG